MSIILENEKIPRYLRVYNYYKELILSGGLKSGTKLPSIRKGSMQLQMSRTTMESAYLLLAAEGYIVSKPQSGYYVTDIAEKKKHMNVSKMQVNRENQEIRYDFVTSSVDKESFRFELWRRYMKSALRQDERLLSYGEPQGEWEFREVLCSYLGERRSVICTPEQIVVGAGVQSLLHILCPLVADRKKVAFYNPDFQQGRAVFEDYGYTFCTKRDEIDHGVYYISPSQMTRWGGLMTIKERLDLIGEANRRDFLIIEDDYNSEFRYFQKPAPSLQGLTGGRGVVYLGTFSKMLLPSIRMSFMVLPPELVKVYEKRRHMYNQTASKAEQIAITQFIRDGHLASQIRKSRKIHLAKATELARVIREVLQEKAETEIGESGFHVYVSLETEFEASELAVRTQKKGLAVFPHPQTEDKERGKTKIMLNCANVMVEDYKSAIQLLKECL